MRTKYYFITGTDTDVGKTVLTSALLSALVMNDFSAIGVKPLASGATLTPEGFRNDDALMLMKHSSVQLPYDQVNPVVFEKPVAPHFLSDDLSAEGLYSALIPAMSADVDYCLVEGVGGWQVPLNERESMPDFAARLSAPVILIVGVRLGCLNHAMLTVNAIAEKGLVLAGWVANTVDPEMLNIEENIASLTRMIKAPLLGVVPYQDHLDVNLMASNLDVRSL